jgi:hypothetical protein
MRIGDRAIGNMQEFADFAKEDWKRAREAFFTREFREVFLENHKEQLSLYQGLAKGRSRDMILDNFLQDTVGKEPILFEMEKEIETEPLKKQEPGHHKQMIRLKKKGWGYGEGRLYSEKGSFQLEREVFCTTDFDEDDTLRIPLIQQEEKIGIDQLILETVFQKTEIDIFWPLEKRKSRGEKREIESRLYPELLHGYVKLRTGAISVEEYVEESTRWIEKAGEEEQDLFLELCRFQVEIIKHQVKKKEEGEDEAYRAIGQNIEEKREAYLKDAQCRNYYYYLMTLYKRDKASLLEAEVQIRAGFEKKQDFYDFWLLLLVNRSYALDKRMQCHTFFDYAQKGINSPLLYLGLLDVLNQDPYYLEDLKDNKAALIGWGIRHGYYPWSFPDILPS